MMMGNERRRQDRSVGSESRRGFAARPVPLIAKYKDRCRDAVVCLAFAGSFGYLLVAVRAYGILMVLGILMGVC